ncbi:MAG TPA: MarR family transcriptional regulator, partial [Candidatus Acidoferrales bacterium]|nr:MarR family transcriptional regulator [Candidatus Acidoferrales bacterium]
SNSSGSAEKKRTLQRITCLKIIGDNGPKNISELATKLKLPRPEAAKTTKELAALGLIKAEKNKNITFTTTTAGLVALTSFKDYQDWVKIKAALAVSHKKNDPLAYALLVVGCCANKPDGVYTALCKYAAQGNTIENISADVSAESLLRFYRQELRVQSITPPAYLSVFKEFTTAGFQEVFKMLILAIKPTAEDYNWLVEFFNEVSEFYFDPARIAFVNLLPESQKLRQNLEEYKKAQDQQIKKQDGNLEVTFTIPGSGLSKIDTMPAHLRAIGMRLILEPAKFINKELVDYFWAN